MGNIVTLQEGKYKYELPREPSDEKEILNHDKKREDQVWRIPPMLDFRSATLSQKVEFIQRERDRWLNGVWILIDGELVYLTGMYYDHLVYQTFDFGKATYLDNQRLDFYFRDLTRKDDHCWGRVFIKPRRYGMTAEELTESTYTSMEDFKVGVGLMSNENKKCTNTLLRPIIDSIFMRPKYMRPHIYSSNGKKPRAALEYNNPNLNTDISDNEIIMLPQFGDWLGGHIFAYPTTPAAIDGEKKKYIVMDEVWKWIVASPQETLDINLKCLRDARWLGKISMLSTMGDSDDYAASVKEGIKIINDSDPDVRDDNGNTTSKLYEYFVSAIYSHDLPNFYNKFGKIDAGRAEEYIMNDRKKLEKGTKKYIFEVRKMPLTKAEALMTATNLSIFDKERITTQLLIINKLPRDKKPYVRGKLISDSNGLVSFEHEENGPWKIQVMPYFSELRNLNLRNRFKKQNGLYVPFENAEGAVGYDPVRYLETTSKNISKASIVVGKKFDYFNTGKINCICAHYLARPEDPEDGHEEFFKAMRFWGYKGMYERQVESVLRRAKEVGMLPFMMKASDGLYGLWTDQNKKVIKSGTDMFQARIKKPETEDSVDGLKQIGIEEILYDADGFDPTNTRIFDTFMSIIMMEHGLLQVHETNLASVSEEGKMIGHQLHPNRQHAGNMP